MRSLIRILFMVFNKWKKPSQQPFETNIAHMRVGITDIDFNFHMNNAKYLNKMEMGRWIESYENGLLPILKKEKVLFFVAAIEITFLKEMKVFEKYQVETTMVGADEKYIYMEQMLRVRDKLCAHAIFKVAMLKGGKIFFPEKLMSLVRTHYGKGVKMRELPAYVSSWKEMSKEKKENLLKSK